MVFLLFLLSFFHKSRLLSLSTQHEEKMTALISENNLLAENIQRLQLTISESENEIALLRKNNNNNSNTSGGHNNNSNENKNSENETDNNNNNNNNTSYEALVSQLREELLSQENTIRTERLKYESSLRDVSLQLQREKDSSQKLRQELQVRPTKNDLLQLNKRLKLVEEIAFPSESSLKKKQQQQENNEEEEEERGKRARESEGEGEEPEITPIIPIEELLAKKIHSIERELVDSKRSNQELQERDNEQKEQLATYKQSLENKAKVIER
jgi:hypothetical protein